MNQFLAFIEKEIYHIIRDKKTLLVLFGLPVIQILLFGYALTNEVKNIKLYVLDMSKDNYSQQIIEKIHASKYFDVGGEIYRIEQADKLLRSGNANMVLVIPYQFAHKLNHQNSASVQLIIDGTNPNVASTTQMYATAIMNEFRDDAFGRLPLPYQIDVKTRMLYNPQLKGAYTFVPGVIALLLMIICTMMTSVSIVREKEMGNMEMLLVSPMRPLTAIFAKTIPYLILSLLVTTIILIMSATLLDVPIKGNILLLYFVCLIFIAASLALGLVISTITNSQQVAMMASLMGLMLPGLMFGGFMFPIESMPKVLQWMSNVVPAKWFYFSINSIMIKGLGLSAVIKEVIILTVYGLSLMAISYKKFKIRLS